jgi:hypothetical protein
VALTCKAHVCPSCAARRIEDLAEHLVQDVLPPMPVYQPHVVAPFSPPHHDLLVRRPSGEWIVFMSDGRELHFAMTCTGCDSSGSAYCTAPEGGGRARLTKVLEASGSGVTLSYDPAQRVLLRLTDDLGHALELRGSTSCPAYASELRYDGALVAHYTVTSSNLSAVDLSGSPIRSYAYGWGTARPKLTAVRDESGINVVEFSYDTSGYAIGVVDSASSVGVSYSGDGWSSTVTEYFHGANGDTSSSHTRGMDYAGHVTSITGGSASGPAQNVSWTPDSRVGCTIDEQGRVDYKQHDAQGRVTYELQYTGESCEIPATLPADAKEVWSEYGATRVVAQGAVLALDVPTRVWRRSALTPGAYATEEYDYDRSPASIDPTGYSCAPSGLPSGSATCRQVSTGYAWLSSGVALERHATFYSYDEKGRLIRTYGPVDLDYPAPNEVPPIEERTYWPDGDTAQRQGRLHEVKRYPSPTAQPLVTVYDYDLFGVSRIVQPDGGQTLIAKDYGVPLAEVDTSRVANPGAGRVESWS